MKKSAVALITVSGVLVASIVIALVVWPNKSSNVSLSPKVKPSEVLTWDCEYPDFKPETIMIYCGDGGAYVSKIKWESWSSEGASGTGEYYKNLCEPDCADGEIVHAPVTVKLSDLTLRKGKYYLRTLDIASVDGKDFSWGEAGTFHWDVMEFAEQMNSD